MPQSHVIVIDLDGTLVNTDGDVSEANRDALALAKEKGHTVLIATGRTWSESHTLLDAAGIEGPVITAGGARLASHPDNRTLDHLGLDDDNALAAATCLTSHDLGVLVLLDPEPSGVEYLHLGPHDLHTVSHWWHEHHDHSVHAIDSPQDMLNFGKVLRLACVGSDQSLATLTPTLNGVLNGAARTWHWEAVTDPQRGHAPVHLLEVFGAEANKWTMVQRWCQCHDQAINSVVAIGDGLNDVVLIEQAPLGIAMGNADPRVSAVADCVVPSNNDDGVAVAIHSLLEGSLP
jgi:Cof subfamily protein (haloacid dehalogenase superfamily)